ncbi:MAG: DUF721 domain-containing protein [Flavobacteriales bacterium]|nr:DUF721 domain-containing protein [Flavobacteriales bacterium]
MASRSYQQQSLKEAIREMLKAGGMDKKFDSLEVVRCFHEVVGPFISSKITSAYVRERTLVIKTSSGPLKHELMMNRRDLVGRVNEQLQQALIENIEIY